MADVIDTVLATKQLKDLKVTKDRSSTTPTLTEDKVENVLLMLLDIEKNNGYVSIAQQAGLSSSQVKEIHKKMNARISELTPKESMEV